MYLPSSFWLIGIHLMHTYWIAAAWPTSGLCFFLPDGGVEPTVGSATPDRGLTCMDWSVGQAPTTRLCMSGSSEISYSVSSLKWDRVLLWSSCSKLYKALASFQGRTFHLMAETWVKLWAYKIQLCFCCLTNMAVNELNVGKQMYIHPHLFWYFWKWKGVRIAHRAESTRVMLEKLVELTVQ